MTVVEHVVNADHRLMRCCGMTPAVGERVRIERDETRYPPKGTWPQFRGRVGTVVEINEDQKRPHLTEYGVVFGKVYPRPDRPGVLRWGGDDVVTWFKAYELTCGAAPQRDSQDRHTPSTPLAPRRALTHLHRASTAGQQ